MSLRKASSFDAYDKLEANVKKQVLERLQKDAIFTLPDEDCLVINSNSAH